MTTENRWSASFAGAAASAMRIYDEIMVPVLFTPWAKLLVDQLQVVAGEAALDVACGPGSVTRVLAERVGPAGSVTGCDLSEAMLAVARAKEASDGDAPVRYVQAPADALPLRDGEFDLLTCQQGLQFFPDRPAALSEMLRVLKPGGRAGVAVWTAIDRSPLFAALGNAVEDAAGAELADRYRGGPWALPDAEQLQALFERAGFSDAQVSTHVVAVTFEGGPAQLAMTLAATPLAAEIDQLSDEQRQVLLDSLARRLGDGPIGSDLESNIALARR